MDNLYQNNTNSKPILLYVLIVILCLTAFSGIVFWQFQKPDKKSGAIKQNQIPTDNQANNTNHNEQQIVDPADELYNRGTIQLQSKNYTDAISYFDQAIAQNPYQPKYYSDKSEAQYNLGQKDQAIQTLKQGISLNSDSDLLKSKLDVLSKDQFSDPNQEAIRE